MNALLQKTETGNVTDNGMARFLSPTNLRRYRSLAGDRLNAAERALVLKTPWATNGTHLNMNTRAVQRSPKTSRLAEF